MNSHFSLHSFRPLGFSPLDWALCCALGLGTAGLAQAQSAHKAKAPTTTAAGEQAAQDGVALAALTADAPDSYTVKSGDTLWSIARVFLKAPWRWPELWGANKGEIKNPHRIYPGQILFLEKTGGRARLHVGRAVGGQAASGGAVRISPKVRVSMLDDGAILPIPDSVIRPFLGEAVVVDDQAFSSAPRIVSGQDDHSLLAKGDRAYVRASNPDDLSMAPGKPTSFRIYRNATPLVDPDTGKVLAYEAHYLGKANLVRPGGTAKGEDGKAVGAAPADASTPVGALFNAKEDRNIFHHAPANTSGTDENGLPYNKVTADKSTEDWRDTWRSTYKGTFDNKLSDEKDASIVPGTIDITSSREEIRAGDRLGPDTDPNALSVYIPHAAPANIRARVMSIYSGEADASQNQIISINKGSQDGIERGQVFALLNKGVLQRDRTDVAAPLLRLPNEVNGTIMIFSVFDKVSYGLVLEIKNPVREGDYAINPNAPANEMMADQ